MRLLIIATALALGGLWFVSGEVHSPPPSPRVATVRHADLSGLRAQLARPVENPWRDPDLSDLRADVLDAPEPDVLIGDLQTGEVYDLSDTEIGQEVIRIEGSAPIIDTSSPTHCFTIETPYTINIPTGRTFEVVLEKSEYTRTIPSSRTFEAVLGAAADSQSEPLFENNGTSNVYVIDETIEVEDHVVDKSAD